MAQNNDSPPKDLERIKVTIQPKELLIEFNSIRSMPPENLPLNFWPNLKEKYKNNEADIRGNNWNNQIEELIDVILEKAAIKISKKDDNFLEFHQQILVNLFLTDYWYGLWD